MMKTTAAAARTATPPIIIQSQPPKEPASAPVSVTLVLPGASTLKRPAEEAEFVERL